MKNYILIISFLVLFSMPSFAHTKIKVLKVYDGDSISAQIDDNVFRIRLIDIDCFEGTKSKRAKWQARKYNLPIDKITEGGNLAGEFLENKLKNKEVFFDFKGIDKYTRALGYLYVGETNINNEMLKTGYCTPYKKRVKSPSR